MAEPSIHDLSLACFQRWEEVILQRLQITQDPATLSDEDKAGLANAYLAIVSE